MDNGLLNHDLKHCPNCKSFFSQIKRHFDYLFDQYSFQLVYCEDSEQFPICLVVLESADCRLRFISDREVPEFSIGTKSARITWEDSDRGTVHGWYGLNALADFLEKRTIHAPFLEQRKVGYLTREEHLVRISDLLRPRCDLVFEFMRQEVFEQRWEEFANFLVERRKETLEQIRRRYPGQL